jgi:hypothetical protein
MNANTVVPIFINESGVASTDQLRSPVMAPLTQRLAAAVTGRTVRTDDPGVAAQAFAADTAHHGRYPNLHRPQDQRRLLVSIHGG